MDALVMCGGRGTRLDADVEKPLFEVGGRPMVDHVLGALAASQVDDVYAVGSPAAPATLDHVDVPTVEAPGEGYVADLGYATDRVTPPVLTVAADLPLLAADAVDAVLDAHEEGSLTVCVPAALKRRLGVAVDTTLDPEEDDVQAPPAEGPLAPTGVNVVGGDVAPEAVHRTHDVRLAVNVNRRKDADVAESLLEGGR